MRRETIIAEKYDSIVIGTGQSGPSLLGIGGDEIIPSILDIMYAGASYKTIQRAMHIRPTVTKLIPTMLGDLRPLV